LAPFPQIPDTGDYLLYGARWRIFQESLDWLSRSRVRAVVIVDAPVNPAWRKHRARSWYLDLQARFSEAVATEAARHPKVRFLDFVSKPLLDADTSLFYDALHFDSVGADIFSAYLGDYLAREFPRERN